MCLAGIRVVMVQTTHPGNIGAAARAMKTMGLSQLVLVAPCHFPHAEATALASGAADILAQAKVVATLDEALADVALAVATSARLRHLPWPHVDARAGAQRMLQEAARHPVALVFGREDRGLTNEELQSCHLHVGIPSDAEYGVLNVAAAVQVLAYELRMAWLQAQEIAPGDEPRMPLLQVPWDEELATLAEVEQFFQHFERVLERVGFLSVQNPRPMLLRLRRMFLRIRPDRLEHNLLRGLLKDVEKALSKREGGT